MKVFTNWIKWKTGWSSPVNYKREGFLHNFGIKYVFDPFRKEREVNVYSWKSKQWF